jgi:hypothetical protein
MQSYFEKAIFTQLVNIYPAFCIRNSFHVHRIPALVQTRRQIMPFHNLTPYFSNIRFSIIRPPRPWSSKHSLTFRFLSAFLILLICYIPCASYYLSDYPSDADNGDISGNICSSRTRTCLNHRGQVFCSRSAFGSGWQSLPRCCYWLSVCV